MKSTFDILNVLKSVINVPEITSVITGKIYAIDFPHSNQDENITINVLNNPKAYLQEGFINVNVYVKALESGRPNLNRFNQIMTVLMPLVDDIKSGSCFFEIDDDKGVFKDQDMDSMYFYNLRLKFQTK